jgi:hypothetical protein
VWSNPPVRGVRPFLLIVACCAVPFGLQNLTPSPKSGRPSIEVRSAMLRTPTGNPIVIYSTAPSPFMATPPPLTVQDYGPHFEAPAVALPPPLP